MLCELLHNKPHEPTGEEEATSREEYPVLQNWSCQWTQEDGFVWNPGQGITEDGARSQKGNFVYSVNVGGFATTASAAASTGVSAVWVRPDNTSHRQAMTAATATPLAIRDRLLQAIDGQSNVSIPSTFLAVINQARRARVSRLEPPLTKWRQCTES